MSERTEGIGWHPVSRVEKYSSDQVAWARRARPGRLLTGDRLRALFRAPEDGIVFDEGNGVTETGILNLALLLTGEGGHPLASGRTVFGVGTDGETAFAPGLVHLAHASGEGHGRSWYRPMDPGYPTAAGAGLLGQATFSEREANMPWMEWCWASGEPGIEAGPVLHECFAGDHVMLNRKAPAAGFGTKEAGVAWVFRTEIILKVGAGAAE